MDQLLQELIENLLRGDRSEALYIAEQLVEDLTAGVMPSFEEVRDVLMLFSDLRNEDDLAGILGDEDF